MIDEQLRQVGWEANTQEIRYAKGVRPVKGRNMAIAEWPTDSTVSKKGYADYALFVGTKLVGIIEAKAEHNDISSVIDYQGKDYPRNIRKEDAKYQIGIWGEFQIEDLDKTEENKKQVRRFLVDVFQNGELDKLETYLAEDLIQHNQEIGQGSQAYKEYILEQAVSYDFVFKVMGQGNHVVSYSKVNLGGQDYAYFDIFPVCFCFPFFVILKFDIAVNSILFQI